MYSLNVLISFIQRSTLRLFWHCFLSIHFKSHPTLSLSHGRRHMLWRPDTCQNVFTDIEKTDQIVFMGWYSMVYYLSNTVCVFYFPRSWWGWLAGVFIKMPESLRCCYEISITLTNLTFFLSSLLVRTFPLKWIWLCFHCTATCGAPSFLLGHNQPRGVLLENTWVEKLFENIFPFNLIQLIVVKVWKSYKGFDWTF